MPKFPEVEGTTVFEVAAPLLWPLRHETALGHIALKEADLALYFLPDKQICATLKYRNGAEVSVNSCPIDFAASDDDGQALFRLAVSWKADDLTIVADGSIIAGNGSVDEKTITLKKEFNTPLGGNHPKAVTLCAGVVGPVPVEFEAAKSELERAARHVENLSEADDLSDASDHWKSYLDAVVKVRNKITAGTQALADDEQKARSWTGQYEKVIRQSELWSYLLHARNADMHGLKAILEKEDGYVGLASDGVTRILSILMTAEGVQIAFTGHPPNVKIVPGKLRPMSVVDRGTSYSPPAGDLDLHQLAQGGLAFLELWLIDTTKKFG